MAIILQQVKQQVQDLYERSPHIHMDVDISRPKLHLKGEKATIVGIYPHIFVIEESSTGKTRQHSLQYTDIIIKQIKIHELQ